MYRCLLITVKVKSMLPYNVPETVAYFIGCFGTTVSGSLHYLQQANQLLGRRLTRAFLVVLKRPVKNATVLFSSFKKIV